MDGPDARGSMPEIIMDSNGYAVGVVYFNVDHWEAKYFVQTHTVQVMNKEDGIEWVRSHSDASR